MRKMAIFLIAIFFISFGVFDILGQQTEQEIWTEFVKALMNDDMTLDRIRPAYDSWKETMLGWLKQIKENTKFAELPAEPEAFRVDNKVHFIIPLHDEDSSRDCIFSFLIKDNTWYFHALEFIFIRLDKVTSLPATEFPDMSEEWKATHREETRIGKLVRLFNFLAEEKGKDFALDWVKDGRGFFLGAQVRVPFFTPSKAFILYLCWQQSNLVGNTVKLVKLEEREAIVELQSQYFHLYKAAAHLKEQISFEDYQKIFESIWHDRAEKAGWHLEIKYHPEYENLVFHFTR